MKKQSVLFLILITSVVSFAGGVIWSGKKSAKDIPSHIYTKEKAKRSTGTWGSIYMYTNDSVSTYGTESMLTAVLEFLPGKKLQDPHQHVEEEFQYIIEGSGTWFLNGKETPIQKGDLMYALPGDVHGISNTGTDTLKFFVMKWISKGARKPAATK